MHHIGDTGRSRFRTLYSRTLYSRSVDARTAELEIELCRIPEVTAARIVVNDQGRPTEVHILASPEKHAKQVVRDIQSVAMASFGVDLDRRVISVVQLEGQERVVVGAVGDEDNDRGMGQTDMGERRAEMREPAVQVDLEGDEVRPAEDEDRVIVDGVVTVRTGLVCVAEVTLQRGGERVKGRAEGTLASAAVHRIVAQATLDALRQVEHGALRADVESASLVRLGERSVALVTIVLLRPPFEEVMAGAGVVRAAGEHDAVARAVLHAVNRRLSQIA